ncbi:MAG TPA: GFA family protein [Steroidobacter sp.]
MRYRGSCHCGKVRFEVEGTVEQVMECNCSHCSRKGYLLWFLPRENLSVTSGADQLGTYTFNKHAIQHHFCPTCGCAPFAFGKDPSGAQKAAVNVRCLEDVQIKNLKIVQVDGRSL